MYHYVYKILNVKENKFYIGIRSSKQKPEEDLGIIYFSSSKIKEFIDDQKTNPQSYQYKILKICKNRKEALEEEIKLHEEFNVSNNPNCYNIVKQTNTKFDTSGFIFIDGTKIKTNVYKHQKEKRYHSYRKHTVIDKDGNHLYVSVDDANYLNGNLKSIQSGKVMARNTKGQPIKISKEEFEKGGYVGINSKKFSYKDKNNNYFMVEINDPRVLSGELVHCTTNLVIARNTQTNEIVTISKEKFDSTHIFVGVNKGKISGKNNPNAKIIKIYNEKKELVIKCYGNFKEICKNKGYPTDALSNSYLNNGRPIYLNSGNSKPKKENLKYIGWYALKENVL